MCDLASEETSVESMSELLDELERVRDRQEKIIALEFVEPCLPSAPKAPPSGPNWIHEIKHDGFLARQRRSKAARCEAKPRSFLF